MTSLISGLTVGQTTMVLHCVLIVIQILVLRKKYEWIQLMQLPVAIIFGSLTDFAVWATSGIQHSAYWQQWLICFAGIFLVAVGVSIEFTAGVVVLAGEGVVLAFSKVFPIKKSNMKMVFDMTLVGISLILLFIFVGRLDGVREGTFVAAIMVGALTKKINPVMEKVAEFFLKRH